jgi:UDP-N-acetylenolpyruvoylglucosamine reductase
VALSVNISAHTTSDSRSVQSNSDLIDIMDSYHERQELPRDRARLRARSMLSTFKNPREEQDGVEVKHDYLLSEHTDEGTIHDVEKDAAGALASATGLDGGQVDSMSPFPALDIGSLPARKSNLK